MNLKPCPYRRADDDGHILCDKIKTGDREVSPNICRVCPVAQINCAHLRAALEHHARPPIVVRWGNGKSQVWDDFAQDSLTLARAACAEKVLPIHSARDCAGCALRKAVDSPQTADRRPTTALPRVVQRAPRPSPLAQPIAPVVQTQPVAAVAAEARSSIVAQKIIQLQEWLARQNRAPQIPDEEERAPISYAPRVAARVVGEEKRVGWTD
ncbi:MAG: hypothetical protein FJ009_15460 [Chloroflexi bacterium]|nr:hypothetical protein [Chloroflexota bacterium]